MENPLNSIYEKWAISAEMTSVWNPKIWLAGAKFSTKFTCYNFYYYCNVIYGVELVKF